MRKIKNPKSALKVTVVLLISFSLLCLGGCEAMKKKFIRKHKGEEQQEPDVVFEPQEYPSQGFTNAQLYQNHYLLWKSWKQELSESLDFDRSGLLPNINHKKLMENSKEMISNLEAMKPLLVEEQQKGLEKIIQKAKIINDKISADNLNANNLYILKSDLETLESSVRKNYTYNKVKKFIKK
jgi:hypothetical protein